MVKVMSWQFRSVETINKAFSRTCQGGERLKGGVLSPVLMHARGSYLSEESIYYLLRDCSKEKDLPSSRILHALIISNQLEVVTILGDCLIRAFASCAKLLEANLVFSLIPNPGVHTWLAIISAHATNGEHYGALDLHHKMQQQGMLPSIFLYACILKSCCGAGELQQGKSVHDEIIKRGHESDVIIGSSLIDMYAKCGELEDARKMFDALPSRNVVSWGAMLVGYVQQGSGIPALKLIEQMHEEQVQPDKVMLQCILKACGFMVAVKQGRITHDQILRGHYESDIIITSALIDMYGRCGRLEEANKVFRSLLHPNEVSWAALITGYVQHGDDFTALELFVVMQGTGLLIDKVTYVCVLKACGNVGQIKLAKLLHDQIIRKKFECDVTLGNAAMDMYCKCSHIHEARKVFDAMQGRDAISWAVMIAGYVQHGLCHTALEFFGTIHREDIVCDEVIYLYSLGACSNLNWLVLGKVIHFEIVSSSLESGAVLGTALVDMYAKCGSLEDSRLVFDKRLDRSIASWSMLISGYIHQGETLSALRLLVEMVDKGKSPNEVTFLCTLKACQSSQDLEWGKLLHNLIMEGKYEGNCAVGSSLVDMYVKCGGLDEARGVFDTLQTRSVVTWAAMISGYAQHGHADVVFELFSQMHLEGTKPDKVIFLCMLKLCASDNATDICMLVHDEVIKCGLHLDIAIGNALIDMYSKSGNFDEAYNVFDRLPNRDSVSWCSVILAEQHKRGFPILDIFESMQQEGMKPNIVIFLCAICACCSKGAFQEGRLVHIEIIKTNIGGDVMIGSTLIDMYCKGGSLEDARQVFDSLAHHDVVSWSAMIAGYAQHGHHLGALKMFHDMQRKGVSPNMATFLSTLKASGSIGALALGHIVHGQLTEAHFECDKLIGNALVDTYASCGSFKDAGKLLSSLLNHDLISWGAMIGGFAYNSQSTSVQQCFEGMECLGLTPGDITYCSILSACSHGGHVEAGQAYFDFMICQHEILPNSEHLNCLVDLLGRAGRLQEAQGLLLTMPPSTDLTGWVSLLSACKTYGDVDVGRQCFDQIIEVDPNFTAGYVLMSNIYANAELWEEFGRVQELRKCAKAWKKPGQAWIEVENSVCKFVVGEQDYPCNDKLHAHLNNLSTFIKTRGFVPQLDVLSESLYEDMDCSFSTQNGAKHPSTDVSIIEVPSVKIGRF